jgi:hypothetical protein
MTNRIIANAEEPGMYDFPYSIRLESRPDGRGRLIEKGFAWHGNEGRVDERRTWIPADKIEACAKFIENPTSWNPMSVLQDAGEIFGEAR